LVLNDQFGYLLGSVERKVNKKNSSSCLIFQL